MMWLTLYVAIGFAVWWVWTPVAHKWPEWYFIPFRVLLWPLVIVGGLRYAFAVGGVGPVLRDIWVDQLVWIAFKSLDVNDPSNLPLLRAIHAWYEARLQQTRARRPRPDGAFSAPKP